MINETNISGYYTTAQVARILGLSSHEVARLSKEEKLKSIRSAGNTLLLDATEVQLFASMRQGKGRPLLPSIAWAALWILSNLEVDWLSYQQLRRLKERLANVSAQDLVWQIRNRSTTRRYRASESFFDKLKDELILSGKSGNLDGFSLTQQSQVIEGYTSDDFEKLVKKYHLFEDTGGNLTTHKALGDKTPINQADTAPIAVVAADLSCSLDSRERQAGLQVLQGLLNENRSD